MSKYFKRSIRLLFGQRGSETAVNLGNSRVEFSIIKTDKRSNNSAEIKVYNLSNETKALLDKNDTVVTLMAGYESGVGTGVVFSGDVSDITTERNGADVATVIELSDGNTVIKDKSVSISMNGAVRPEDVLKRIARDIGLEISISGKITSKPYQNGFTAYGAPMLAVTKVCNKIGYSYSVENGILKIWETVKGKEEQVLFLSPETGLIGRPEKIKIDKKNGWNVKSLLNPLIVPAGKIKVSSENVSGILKIKTVKFTGDTHGNDWNSEMECLIVS